MTIDSERLKILTIFGTRPEAIKLAPVLLELEKHPDVVHSIVCVTAQHREMLDAVLNNFSIVPHYDLDLMRPNQTLFETTANALIGLKDVLDEETPHLVLVQGDTTTAFVGSLAAFYSRIKVGHVEAGLRTADKFQPFPEEVNRRLVTPIADLHFAPTERAQANLLREGVDPAGVYVTGNTVVDALLEMSKREQHNGKHIAFFHQLGIPFVPGKKYVLITGHRRESFGAGLKNVFEALKKIAAVFEDTEIIYPVHLNPNVSIPAKQILDGTKNIHLVSPLDYDRFVFLMAKCSLIITDSGGIQEEAPSLGIPVLVTRNKTERPEGVECGVVKLVGTDPERIVAEATKVLQKPRRGKDNNTRANPYGDGRASERIVRIILAQFGVIGSTSELTTVTHA